MVTNERNAFEEQRKQRDAFQILDSKTLPPFI